MIGTILKRVDNGYIVDVFRAGQHVTYGPMHFLGDFPKIIDGGNARTRNPDRLRPWEFVHQDPFDSGDTVFLLPLGTYRDQFVIAGRYVDMTPAPQQDIQIDQDGDGVFDIIEQSYQEGEYLPPDYEEEP